MSATVFVGPSLRESITTGPHIAIQAPAVAGDIYRAVRTGVELIGLIDARFENGQTVLHDEILYALSEGVPVWGAASMGALRAVECEPFGMQGYGDIFEMYRSGLVDGDHEVAMQYGPEELGWPPLTVPLVNIRATLGNAVAAGTLDKTEAARVLGAAQEIFYKDLTWERLCNSLPVRELRSKLLDWLPKGYVDLKNQDARGLIELIDSQSGTKPTPHEPAFEFQETVFWREFVANEAQAVSTLSEQDAAVMDELRLDPLRYSDAVQRAFARRMAIEVLDEDFQEGVATAEEIRTDFGLMTAEAYTDWLTQNRTDEESLVQFLDWDSHLENTLESVADTLASDILNELRAENEYIALDQRATAKRDRLAERDFTNVPSAYAEFDLRDLLAWFCESRGVKGSFSDPEEAARSLGLPNRNALHLLLRRELEYSRTVE